MAELESAHGLGHEQNRVLQRIFNAVCASFWRAHSLQIISPPSWKLLYSSLCSTQGSRSSTWIPLQPEESSSQDTEGAPQHCDPSHLGCLWTVGGTKLLSISPLWFYWSSINLAVSTRRKSNWPHKFLPTATLHGTMFQQLAASSSCRFTSWLSAQHLIIIPPPANWVPYKGQVLLGTIHSTGTEIH